MFSLISEWRLDVSEISYRQIWTSCLIKYYDKQILCNINYWKIPVCLKKHIHYITIILHRPKNYIKNTYYV